MWPVELRRLAFAVAVGASARRGSRRAARDRRAAGRGGGVARARRAARADGDRPAGWRRRSTNCPPCSTRPCRCGRSISTCRRRSSPAARWLAFVMQDREQFAALGLMPAERPEFVNGYANGWEFWLVEQPSDYYRRHLLLHEGTHAFMQIEARRRRAAVVHGGHGGAAWARTQWRDGRLQAGRDAGAPRRRADVGPHQADPRRGRRRARRGRSSACWRSTTAER